VPRIPLFPLDVVLFPGMPLPLRIFEPRYHQMLRDLEGREGFGVVLIREGQEVGGRAEPHPVGTLARIEQRLDEGAVTYVVARGSRRFRITRTVRERPYMEGEVAWLADPDPGEPAHDPRGHGHAHLAVELEVAALFEEYLRFLARLTRVPVDDEIRELMEGHRQASPWAMACAIGGTLLVPPSLKQPILEAPSVHDALHLEQELLARENARLRKLARSVDARMN
jgi:Lon protease-like protein